MEPEPRWQVPGTLIAVRSKDKHLIRLVAHHQPRPVEDLAALVVLKFIDGDFELTNHSPTHRDPRIRVFEF